MVLWPTDLEGNSPRGRRENGIRWERERVEREGWRGGEFDRGIMRRRRRRRRRSRRRKRRKRRRRRRRRRREVQIEREGGES